MEGQRNCMKINECPDDILLFIFSKLSFLDQTHCSTVCRRWYSLVRSLKQKTIAINISMNGHLLHHLIQNQFSDELENFELMNIKLRGPVVLMNTLAIAALKAKCSKLRRLVLAGCMFNREVTLYHMPASLQQLSLRNSELSVNDFFEEPSCGLNASDDIHVNSKGSVQNLHNDLDWTYPQNATKRLKVGLHLPNLTCLDMCHIALMSNKTVHVLLKLKNLRCLILQQCQSITDNGIELITDMLPQLRVFDVEGTRISDEGVKHILTHGTNLKELYIGYNLITDDALIDIPTSRILQLSTLCLKCTSISPDFTEQLNRTVGSQVNILSSHVKARYPLGCNHYFSHICC